MKIGVPIIAAAVVVNADAKVRGVVPVSSPQPSEVAPASPIAAVQLACAHTTVSKVMSVPMLLVLMRRRALVRGV